MSLKETMLFRYFRISMKHVDRALKYLDTIKRGEEPSILQKVLELEEDPKIACILALDMFLVGVDTVSKT